MVLIVTDGSWALLGKENANNRVNREKSNFLFIVSDYIWFTADKDTNK
jgi:hypothetical protein